MLRDFFRDRYGVDKFGIALLFISVVFVNLNYVWIIGVGLVCYTVFRMLSKNKSKRYQELQWYIKIENRIRIYLLPVTKIIVKGFESGYKKLNNYKMRFEQRKYFAFVKCSKCKNTLKIPRNKGKIRVTCPVCKQKFVRKT